MKYVLDEKVANAILNYLVKQPYIEVANLIQSIQLLPPAEIVDNPEVSEKFQSTE